MTILVERFPGYRRITLNRPERLNALTVEMAAALNTALDDAEADKSCRALLLTGAGRGFCAGQDLNEIVGAAPSDLTRLLEHYHPLILKLRALPIPIVCAVNGVAAGAGWVPGAICGMSWPDRVAFGSPFQFHPSLSGT